MSLPLVTVKTFSAESKSPTLIDRLIDDLTPYSFVKEEVIGKETQYDLSIPSILGGRLILYLEDPVEKGAPKRNMATFSYMEGARRDYLSFVLNILDKRGFEEVEEEE